MFESPLLDFCPARPARLDLPGSTCPARPARLDLPGSTCPARPARLDLPGSTVFPDNPDSAASAWSMASGSGLAKVAPSALDDLT
jgi:hypothetical protein